MNANRLSSAWKVSRWLFLIVVLTCCFLGSVDSSDKKAENAPAASEATPAERLTSRPCPDAAPVKTEKVGLEIKTDAGQRRRVVLECGVVLYVNQNTQVKYA